MAERGRTRLEAALEALARYREERARDGGGRVGAAECLLQRVASVGDEEPRLRRRIELVEKAVEEGWMDREMAGEVYDVAREEGLEPAFAFELVRCGVAVCGPEEAPEAPTVEKGRPAWLEEPVPEEEALHERRLRMSFRRLRHLLEEKGSPEEALIAFAEEPDVDTCGY